MRFLEFLLPLGFLASFGTVHGATVPQQGVEYEVASEHWSLIGRFENEALKNYLTDRGLSKIPERIIGGADAEAGSAPFIAQLRRQNKKGETFKFICGGSLITPRTVLSAAHCVIRSNAMHLRYGTNDPAQSKLPDLEFSKAIVHPKWDQTEVHNDISLFILTKPITPSENVKIVSLNDDVTIGANATLTLYGFGMTKSDNKFHQAKVMRKTHQEIVDKKTCKEYIERIGGKLHDGMLCAKGTNTSACNGDSGGPLVLRESEKQIGIVSFGTRGCPENSINVYTNVTHYLSWIQKYKVD